MARIEAVAYTPKFSKLVYESRERQEHNDCAVKAVALVTDTPYEVVHDIMKKLGRKNRRGTYNSITRQTIMLLGYQIKDWNRMDLRAVIETYPGVHVNLRSITTHHPRRFRQAWLPLREKKMLLFTSGHVAAFFEGEVHDWTVNKAKRVRTIWEVTKK